MNPLPSSCWNTSVELLNKSLDKEFAYQAPSIVDAVILPSMIGIICSTGLVGNILIVVTIIRSRKQTIPDIYICNLAVADLVHITGMPFLIHQWAQGGQWIFGGPLCTIITSLDTCNQFACSAIMTVMSMDRYTLYLTITTFLFPLPLILMCYILILCYTWELYQQNKDAGCYNPNVPRQRVMKLTKMVLVLVAVFILSAAPYHVIQLVNLQIEQPTLVFYVGYYLSICLSYTSSSINPFLYILLSGNFRKRLLQIQRKMTERKINNMENTLNSNF
ncbi:melanin-concentrating hormone receptor 2 [Orycteropus afer afer]|uniref:Melanin-concentrating hormone receptor 2 n=1 Tax=Orycteropus afer afer TaxID=1230840 RepID=A0A8B6ZXR1_ORYAF|nr:melanin-concentrating hormone receptor 2 [Orycteropus afer afer]